MQNPASVLESSAHKLLWNFDSDSDYLISARRPDLIIINKNVNIAILPNHRAKLKENENKYKYLDLASEMKKKQQKTVKHESDVYTNCNWCFDTVTKGLLIGLEDLEVT